MPEGPSIVLEGPSDLVQAAMAADVLIEQPCAGDGSCGRCRVRFVEGAPTPSAADCDRLTADERHAGWRLACQAVVAADAAIELQHAARAPGVKSFGDAAPLPSGRVPVRAGPGWAVALDIGTTTLAAALVDLETGRVGAADTALNPQAGVGPDVMSRILYAGRGEREREALTGAVRRGVASLVTGLCRSLETDPARVASAAVVGNPTMLHLWRGLDPAGLGVAPYLGQWTGAAHCRAEEVGLAIGPDAEVYVFPAVRSHVGADAVAAAVAVDLDLAEEPMLLLDLGTNSEILLGGRRSVVAASTAAGPAFEGGAVSCGMRAAAGAIDACRIEADGRVSAHVIGGGPPTGICGSGLLDAVSELRRVGAIDASGRMAARGDDLSGVPRRVGERLIGAARDRAFLVAGKPGQPESVALTCADVRQVQLAVGAVRAGVDLLCAEAGVEPAAIARVCIAGMLGLSVRLRSVFRLGLLPDVDAERVHVVGNAAGAGARLGLADVGARLRAEAFARRARYVELAGRADYAEAFAGRLRFPDLTRW